MGGLAEILLSVAAQVGAPIVKGILTDHIGGKAGEIGGTIIDAVATSAGVAPEALPNLPAEDLQKAVQDVEAQAPALVLAYVEAQRLGNQLQLAEMSKETLFAWGWRPAFMWMLGVLWFWALVIQPLFAALARVPLQPVDFSALMTLTGMFMGLYMGGHTLKSVVNKGV